MASDGAGERMARLRTRRLILLCLACSKFSTPALGSCPCRHNTSSRQGSRPRLPGTSNLLSKTTAPRDGTPAAFLAWPLRLSSTLPRRRFTQTRADWSCCVACTCAAERVWILDAGGACVLHDVPHRLVDAKTWPRSMCCAGCVLGVASKQDSARIWQPIWHLCSAHGSCCRG